MHFSRAQLRQINETFHFEQVPTEPRQAKPSLEAYGSGESAAGLLTVLTSEAHIFKLAALRGGDDADPTIEAAHQRLLTISGCNADQIQLANFQRDVKVLPSEFVDFDPSSGTVHLKHRGMIALALGGTLLTNFSLKHKQRIRPWVGNRLVREETLRSKLASPQLHRMHIISLLLPRDRSLMGAQFCEGDSRLEYRNALDILGKLASAGIVQKQRMQTKAVKYDWRLTNSLRPAATTLIRCLGAYVSPDQATIETGLDQIDYLLAKERAHTTIGLYRRGVISCGNAMRPEPITFNDRLGVMFDQFSPGTALSAAQVTQYLGEKVTVDRLRRQVGKPGCSVPIECIETPHPSGSWLRFRIKRPDFSTA